MMNQELLLHHLQWMFGKRYVHRTVSTGEQQFCRSAAAREGGNEIDRGMIRPMKIFQDQYQRRVRSNRLQRLRNFTQHPLAGSTQDFALQYLALFAFYQRWKLDQPGRSFRREDLDHRVSRGGPA